MFRIDEKLKRTVVVKEQQLNTIKDITEAPVAETINFLEEYTTGGPNLPKWFIDAVEAQDWTLHEYETDFELENWSPAGEDLIVYGTKENFWQDIINYAENFDQDEHIEMWVQAKASGSTGGIPSIRELVEDASAIQEMLDELADAVNLAALDNNTGEEIVENHRVVKENNKDSEDEFNQLKRYIDVEIPDLCRDITEIIFNHNYSWHSIQCMLNDAKTAYTKLNNIFQESGEAAD